MKDSSVLIVAFWVVLMVPIAALMSGRIHAGNKTSGVQYAASICFGGVIGSMAGLGSARLVLGVSSSSIGDALLMAFALTLVTCPSLLLIAFVIRCTDASTSQIVRLAPSKVMVSFLAALTMMAVIGFFTIMSTESKRGLRPPGQTTVFADPQKVSTKLQGQEVTALVSKELLRRKRSSGVWPTKEADLDDMERTSDLRYYNIQLKYKGSDGTFISYQMMYDQNGQRASHILMLPANSDRSR